MNNNNKDILKEFNLPENNRRAQSTVYLKIIFLPVVVFLFFLAGFLGFIDFKVELHTVIMMGFILCVALIFSRHSMEFACYLFEQRNVEFKRELKEYILKTLLTIGKDTKSNGSFDDFVYNYSKDIRADNYSSIGMGIFPMLGILGTFLSIAISMPSFSSSDTVALESEISELLSGVGTAFYVSIYGIFLALWWIFFERFGLNRYKKLINRQKLSTKSFFWSKEEVEQKYMQESLGSFRKIGKVFEYVSNQKFFEELDNTIERKYTNFTHMLKAEEDAVKLSNEHIKQTMNTLIKSQNEQKDLVKIHCEIINVLNMFNENLKQMQLKFTEDYVRLHDISDNRLTRFEKGIFQFGNEISRFSGKLNKFSDEILEKQKEALDGFKTGMIEGMQAFRVIFDSENNINDESLEIIDKLKSDIEETSKEANLAIAKLKTTSEFENLNNQKNKKQKEPDLKQEKDNLNDLNLDKKLETFLKDEVLSQAQNDELNKENKTDKKEEN